MYTTIDRNTGILDDSDSQHSSIISESSHTGLNKFKNFVKDLARKKPRGGEGKGLLEDEHSSSSSLPQKDALCLQFLLTSPASSTSSILDLEKFDKYSKKEEAPSLLTYSDSSSTSAGTLSKEELKFVQTILEEEEEDDDDIDESSSSSFAPSSEEEEDLPCSRSYVDAFNNLDANRHKEDRVNVSLSAPKGACWEVILTPKRTTALLQAITDVQNDGNDNYAKKTRTTTMERVRSRKVKNKFAKFLTTKSNSSSCAAAAACKDNTETTYAETDIDWTTEDSNSKEDDNFLIRPLPPTNNNTSSSSPSLISPASVPNILISQLTRDSAWTLSPDSFDTKIESLKKKTSIPKNALSPRSNITTTTASSSRYRMRKSNSKRNIVQSTRGSKMNRASSVKDLSSSSRTAAAHKTLKKTNSSRHLQGNCSTKRRQQRPKSPSSEKIPTNNNSAKSRHSKTAGGASTSNNTNSTNRRGFPKSKSLRNINCSIDKKSKDASLKAGRSSMMKNSKAASDRDILQRRSNRTDDSNDETTKRNNNDNERRGRRENRTSVAVESKSSVEKRSSVMKRGKSASDRHLFRSHENGGGRRETKREQQSHRTSSTDKRSSMMKKGKVLSDRPLIGGERHKQRREQQQHQHNTCTRSTERVKKEDRERLQREQEQQHHHSSERKGRKIILAASGKSPSVRDLRKEMSIQLNNTANTAAETTTTTGTAEIEERKQQEPQRRALMRGKSFFISEQQQQGKREKDFERKAPQRETSFSVSKFDRKSLRRSLSVSEHSTGFGRSMLALSQKRGKKTTLSVSEHHNNSNMDSGKFERKVPQKEKSFCNQSKHNTSSNTEQSNAATKMTTTTITNGNDKLSPHFDASPSDMPSLVDNSPFSRQSSLFDNSLFSRQSSLVDNSPFSRQSLYARTVIKRMHEEKNKNIIKPSLNNATTATAAANNSITKGSVDRLLNALLIVPDQDDCSVISDLQIPASLLTSPSSVVSKSVLALGKTIEE